MKRTKLVFTLFLCFSAFCFTSCQKPVDSSTLYQTLAGTYVVTGLELRASDGTTKDLFPSLDDCQKQSRQTLKPDGAYELSDACNGGNTEKGSWHLIGTAQISINGLPGDLLSINDDKVVISFVNVMGLQGKVVETLSRR